MKFINALVACEESQAFTIELRELGINAFSCDLQKCSGGAPQWHIIDDATKFLTGDVFFRTEDGKLHYIEAWDLLIAHPPCTYLTKAGNVYMYDAPGKVNAARFEKLLQARELFFKFYNCKISHIAIENPVPFHIAELPPRTCCINPFEYGEKWTKATCLWLKNLPTPFPEAFYPKKNCKSWTHCTRGGKKRSKTFHGIAKSLSRQWADFLFSEYSK